MVLLGLSEKDSVVEFLCLHASFQSWALVSDTCMFVIYIAFFRYSRAATAAGFCCSCQIFGGVLSNILGSAFQHRACLNPWGGIICTIKSPFLHLSGP